MIACCFFSALKGILFFRTQRIAIQFFQSVKLTWNQADCAMLLLGLQCTFLRGGMVYSFQPENIIFQSVIAFQLPLRWREAAKGIITRVHNEQIVFGWPRVACEYISRGTRERVAESKRRFASPEKISRLSAPQSRTVVAHFLSKLDPARLSTIAKLRYSRVDFRGHARKLRFHMRKLDRGERSTIVSLRTSQYAAAIVTFVLPKLKFWLSRRRPQNLCTKQNCTKQKFRRQAAKAKLTAKMFLV
jgi:hypothetical protein